MTDNTITRRINEWLNHRKWTAESEIGFCNARINEFEARKADALKEIKAIKLLLEERERLEEPQ